MNPKCEVCGKPLTPIVYGYPDAETFAKAHRGQVILGGCILPEQRPTHWCIICKRKETFDPQQENTNEPSNN